MYAEPGYLPHSKPAMYTLALQNGRSPTCLLCLPALLCFPARAKQPSTCRVSAVPPPPAILPKEQRERTNPLLCPQLLKQRSHQPRAQSKTIEVNLQVSIVGFVLFFFPFLPCKMSLLFLFSTGLANILLLQPKLCPVTELHIGFT